MRMRPRWWRGSGSCIRSTSRSRAYPECHPDSADVSTDLDNLRRKVDAGATRAITQFFHEADTFFRFRDAAAAAGIGAEIVPGIMPVVNFASVQRMSAMVRNSCSRLDGPVVRRPG